MFAVFKICKKNYQPSDAPLVSRLLCHNLPPLSISLLWTFVYAHAVLDVCSLCFMLLPGFAPVLHLVAAVSGKCPCLVFPYDSIDCFMRDGCAFKLKPAYYPEWRPLLFLYELFDAPYKDITGASVAWSTCASASCLLHPPCPAHTCRLP